MDLPSYLQEVVEKKIQTIPLKMLAKHAQELTKRYRSDHFSLYPELLLAYLAFRFPATFSVVADVVEEVIRKNPSLQIASFLDLGCGPCTGFFALEQFFRLEKATFWEKDKSFLELGKGLIKEASPSFFPKSTWVHKDMEKAEEFAAHDLVLLSYSLGELSSHWEKVLSKAWSATNKILIIIEPGTPRNFEKVKKAREKVLSWGGYPVAPCPGSGPCPMEKEDWCHFASRVSRSSIHRKTKQASLGHEDEKFSYLVFSKELMNLSRARILRNPIKNPGFVSLTLCEKEGKRIIHVPHREKEAYKKARKSSWGEEWDIPSSE